MINTETELPEGWVWQRLDDLLVSLETGTRPIGGAVGILDGVPSLSAEHMTINGTFNFTNLRYVPHEFYSQMNRGHIQQDDILIVKDGATTGKTCFIDESFPFSEAVINEHVFICRANPEKVCSKYLFFWLWGENAQTAIQSTFQGAAIGGINQKFVEKVFVPLPSLPEQKRIAAMLTEQLAAVEKARKASEARLETARALPTAYLREVFEGEDAKKWSWTNLENIARLLPSKSIATDGDTEVIAITTGCLTENGFDINGVKAAKMWQRDADVCRVQVGEILIARSNTPDLVGRVSVFQGVPHDVVASDLTIRISSYEHIRSDFLGYFMSYLFVTGYWRDNSGGASGTMKKITRTQVLTKKIPLPSHDAQTRLTEYLDSKMDNVKKMTEIITSEKDYISLLSASLLRQAFSGAL